jgi:hypothetical protein
MLHAKWIALYRIEYTQKDDLVNTIDKQVSARSVTNRRFCCGVPLVANTPLNKCGGSDTPGGWKTRKKESTVYSICAILVVVSK